MKANLGHKTLARPFRLLLVLALVALLVLGVTPPAGTAAPQESKMYVTNYGNDTISKANLGGKMWRAWGTSTARLSAQMASRWTWLMARCM